MLYSLSLSFSNYDMSVRPAKFVGLNNYIKLLSDGQVWNSIVVTFTFACSAIVIELVVGFALALIVDYIGFLRGLLRTLLTVPILLTPVVLGVVWRVMLNYDFGIVNYLIGLLGFPKGNWLQEPTLALAILILLDSWHQIPFVMLVLAAGLASLPRETFEAADIDGASGWQKIRMLTIPMLRPVILVVVVFRSYALLGAFDFIFSLTDGGPARATQVLSHLIYTRLFLSFEAGYSSAIGWLLLAITLAVVLFLFTRIEARGNDSTSVSRATGRPGILAPLTEAIKRLFDFLSFLLGALGAGLSWIFRTVTTPVARRLNIEAGVRGRRRIGVAVGSLALLIWLLISLFPVYWVYASSLKDPIDVFAIPPKWLFTPTTHNYEVVLGLRYGTEAELSMLGVTPPLSKLPQNFLNSLTISTATTIISLALGTLAAYALVRLRIRHQGAVLTGILVTRMIPRISLALPLFILWRSLGLIDTLYGLTLAYLSFSIPFTVWMMRGYLLDVPEELEDSAMVDGCSRLGALFRITLPLVAPGLSATAVFTFLGCWNEFLFGLLLSNNVAKPVTVEIMTFLTPQAVLYGRLFAASGLILLPVVIFTLFAQRYVATGLTGGALKG